MAEQYEHSLSSWVTSHPAELTLEDLNVKSDLTQLQRVERYVTSPIALQRLVHVKMFARIAQEEGFVSFINIYTESFLLTNHHLSFPFYL